MIDGYTIFDAHMHHAGIFMPRGKSFIDYMDENGIDRAIVNTLNLKANLTDVLRGMSGDFTAKIREPGFEIFKEFRVAGQPDHNTLETIVKQAPDRVIPFFWYNPADPADPDQQKGLALVERALDRGFRGVKIQPAMTPCEIERLYPVAGLLVERGLPIFIHPNAGIFAARRTHPLEIESLARKFPKLNVILAHAAYSMEFCVEAMSLLQGIPNVYFETSTSVNYGILTYIKVFGPKRVLFGTDAPAAGPFRLEYEKIKVIDIPPKARQQVLADNMARLVGLT